MNELLEKYGKRNEILIVNGFNFHYEVYGFILEFCNKYNIEATILCIGQHDEWNSIYKEKYKFNILTLPADIDINTYLFVLLITDDDSIINDNIINNNVVCIDHYYKNRRPSIKYHIPIISFNDYMNKYILPVYEYIDYNTKIELLSKNKRPIISFVGSSTLPYCKDTLYKTINNIDDFDIYIISREIPKTTEFEELSKLPNVYVFEKISTKKLFKYLLSSNYMCYIPNKYNQNSIDQYNNIAMTSSLPISFTCGCKLIYPSYLNKVLQLTSIVSYDEDSSITLDIKPSIIATFQERDRLIELRDKVIFNLDHMDIYKDIIKKQEEYEK